MFWKNIAGQSLLKTSLGSPVTANKIYDEHRLVEIYYLYFHVFWYFLHFSCKINLIMKYVI